MFLLFFVQVFFCYKMIHGLCDISLPVDYAYKNTRGNSLKLNKQFCSTDVRKYFLAAGSLMLGIACLMML